MSYRIFIEKPARKFIAKQPKAQQQRILTALYSLPHEGDISPMRGAQGQYRVRIGTYRAIYTVEHDVLTVDVLEVDNRGDVYKGR